jgi:hypothetical protein
MIIESAPGVILGPSSCSQYNVMNTEFRRSRE